MSHLITETATKYEENLTFNLEKARARRIEIVQFIKETELEISQTDGRKKTLIESLMKRIEQMKISVAQIEEKIHEMDSLAAHVEEIADLDDQISMFCKKRDELLNKNMLMHSYLKVKAYGML